jgi:hypothetical protein
MEEIRKRSILEENEMEMNHSCRFLYLNVGITETFHLHAEVS